MLDLVKQFGTFEDGEDMISNESDETYQNRTADDRHVVVNILS